MFVIYLQQTVDEMGDVLEVRRRGRHIMQLVCLITARCRTLPPVQKIVYLP